MLKAQWIYSKSTWHPPGGIPGGAHEKLKIRVFDGLGLMLRICNGDEDIDKAQGKTESVSRGV